jgi:hypothetical protein
LTDPLVKTHNRARLHDLAAYDELRQAGHLQ